MVLGAEVGDHFGHPQAAQVTKSKPAFANGWRCLSIGIDSTVGIWDTLPSLWALLHERDLGDLWIRLQVEDSRPDPYVAAVWRAFIIFNWGFDLFDLSSVRVPGPVPHPGFQKQQFSRNVGLFWGVRGRPSLPHPADLGGPGAPGPELKNIFLITARG